jgi:hypothetical protein
MTNLAMNASATKPDPAADLLADARCPRCGYPLRGLIEYRCPECGAAFGPAVVTATFVPRWPRLMAWYLAACVAVMILELLPALLRWNPYFLLVHRLGDKPLQDVANIAHLGDAALTCALGPIAIIGLYRQRDWARKACILIFATAVLAHLSLLEVFVGYPARYLNAREALRMALGSLVFVGRAVCPALLVAFLTTGVRRRSLTRRPDRSSPPARLNVFHLRHDWLLLTVFLLVSLGAEQALTGVSTLATLISASKLISSTTPIAKGIGPMAVEYAIWIAAGGFTLAAGIWVWRRPAAVRGMLAAVVLVTVGVWVAGVVAGIAVDKAMGTATSAFSLMMSSAAGGLTDLLPRLAMLLFAFLAVSRDDIRRLTPVPRRS